MTEIDGCEDVLNPTGDMALVGEEPQSHLVSMQVIQDVYNELTGKTEELSRGYEIPYRICYEDIEQLNHKITQLYEQYNVRSSTCSVTVYHENDQKQVFSSFDRFKLYDKSLLSPTESILLKYNLLILLPKLQKPQTYTVSVRIGSKVTMLKNMESSNLPKIMIKMISGRAAQVSVEYIDYTVARNLIDTVDSWFKGVDTVKYPAIFRAIKRNSHYIPSITKYAVGFFSGYLCIKYSPEFIDNTETGILEIYFIALITFAFIFSAYSLARHFGRVSERNLDLMTELSYLKLNRGDEKEIEKFKENNKKGLIKAILGIVGAFAVGVASSVVAFLITT